MGSDDHVLRSDQRVVHLDGLCGYNVHGSSCHLSAVKGVPQILLHNERTSGVVDDHNAVLHLCDSVFIDNALCVREERAVKGDHIGLLEHCVQIRVVAGVALQLFFREGVVCQHLHAESLGNLSCVLSDAAKSDDTHCLAVQLHERIFPEAPVRIACPLTGLYRVRVLSDMVAQLQEQSDGELGYSRCPVCRDIGYRNSLFLCSRRVHDVVAGSQNADKFHIRAGVQRLFCDGSLVCVDNLRVADALCHVLGLCPVIDCQVAKCLHPLPGDVSRI